MVNHVKLHDASKNMSNKQRGTEGSGVVRYGGDGGVVGISGGMPLSVARYGPTIRKYARTQSELGCQFGGVLVSSEVRDDLRNPRCRIKS